jgi:hypothetical protein
VIEALTAIFLLLVIVAGAVILADLLGKKGL